MKGAQIMAHTLSTLRLMAAATSLLALQACTVLPSSSSVTASPWANYAEAKQAFDRIDTSTTKEALVILGFDPAALANTKQLNYVDIVNLFGSAFRLEDLPKGVKTCVEARETCNGYIIRSQNIKNKRDGNIPADLFGFRKQTSTSGWEFNATLVLVNNTVVYKLWNGTPNIESTNKESNPLGPMQSLDGIIPTPF
jgi:hypothetical protein